MYFSCRTRLHFQQRSMSRPPCLQFVASELLEIPIAVDALHLVLSAETNLENLRGALCRTLGVVASVKVQVLGTDRLPDMVMLLLWLNQPTADEPKKRKCATNDNLKHVRP